MLTRISCKSVCRIVTKYRSLENSCVSIYWLFFRKRKMTTKGNFVCACANLWLSEPWLAFLQREMFNVYIFCTKFSWLSWFLLASVENENCVQPPFIGYSKINGNYFNDKMEFKCEESSSSRDLNGNKTIKTFSSIRFLRYIMEISMHVISIYWY